MVPDDFSLLSGLKNDNYSLGEMLKKKKLGEK